ncbi:MAG: methyltransferase domain-containing protein [Acutalibacteraceae bacterium]
MTANNRASDWNAEQYMAFARERTQPAVDLINRIGICPNSILDIGCGPGNSTDMLLHRWNTAEIVGIDSSDSMLKKARDAHPAVNFVKCTVPDELNRLNGPFDLIFSNACIHWIAGHEKLLTDMMHIVSDNGALAVQIPFIQKAPFYRILYRLIDDKWPTLKGIRLFHNLMPEEYDKLLSRISSHFDMWETTYYHRVNGYEGVLDWYKGSGLRPYLDRLNRDEKSAFSADLLAAVEEQYSQQDDGCVILKMPRLFFCAYK